MKYLLLMVLIFGPFLSKAQNATESILRGNQYYQSGEFNLAEVEYRKALQYEADNDKAKYNLANALQRQNKFDEAAKLLDDLAGSTKNNSVKSSAYYNQGVAYTKMQNLDASIESYKKALRINPADQEARENLEKALLQKKKQNQSSQQNKSQSNMSQKEVQQKLDMLNQKEKQLHQRKDKEQQGSGQAQDW